MKHVCKHDAETLKELQSLPLSMKIFETRQRIAEWVEHWGEDKCYVAFSGGKDSTVLLDIVRRDYPNIPAVFCNTGLEFPEIVQFVRSVDNVVWLKPKMSFQEVIEKYGYPVISKEQSQFITEARNTKSEKLRNTRLNGNACGRGKVSNKWKFLLNAPFKISHKCCDIMKKNPSKSYEKETGRKPMIGTMAGESQLRRQKYLRDGCNAFEVKRPNSTPISFWTDDDIWQYIKTKEISYSDIYNKGEDRTGCVFCMFGCHKDTPNRFERLAKTHPKLHAYCMNKLGIQTVLVFIGLRTGLEETLTQTEFDF